MLVSVTGVGVLVSATGVGMLVGVETGVVVSSSSLSTGGGVDAAGAPNLGPRKYPAMMMIAKVTAHVGQDQVNLMRAGVTSAILLKMLPLTSEIVSTTGLFVAAFHAVVRVEPAAARAELAGPAH